MMAQMGTGSTGAEQARRTALRKKLAGQSKTGTGPSPYGQASTPTAEQQAILNANKSKPGSSTYQLQGGSRTGEGPSPYGTTAKPTTAQQAVLNANKERVGSSTYAPEQNAYDDRRAVIEQENKEDAEARKRALAQRIAGQGFEGGSGLLERQQGVLDVELAKIGQRRLGAVDIEELQAGERREEAAAGREFVASQADLDRELNREVEAGRMSLADRQMAQQASQFNTQQEWTEEAFRMGLDENQANRAWQSSEAAKGRVYATNERIATQEFQTGLQTLLNTFTQQNMTLQDQLAQGAEIRNVQSDAAYREGVANPDGEMPEKYADNPLLAGAYAAGQSGRSYDDYKTDRQEAINFQNIAIMTLDPTSPNFMAQLREIQKGVSSATPNPVTAALPPEVENGQRIEGRTTMIEGIPHDIYIGTDNKYHYVNRYTGEVWGE